MLRSLSVAALLCAVLTIVLATPASARTTDRCANHLCTKVKPHTTSCWSHHGRARIAKCFIRRAARHFHQSRSEAYYIAYRESRYNWRVTNSSSGAAGLYQFMWGTWRNTPYHRHSPYNPKWASLAAMWLWSRGGKSHWAI